MSYNCVPLSSWICQVLRKSNTSFTSLGFWDTKVCVYMCTCVCSNQLHLTAWQLISLKWRLIWWFLNIRWAGGDWLFSLEQSIQTLFWVDTFTLWKYCPWIKVKMNKRNIYRNHSEIGDCSLCNMAELMICYLLYIPGSCVCLINLVACEVT